MSSPWCRHDSVYIDQVWNVYILWESFQMPSSLEIWEIQLSPMYLRNRTLSLYNRVTESLPARDSVQMWMIFVQYVKMNFKSRFFSSVNIYFVERKNMATIQNCDFRPYKQMETWSHFITALNMWSFKLYIKAPKCQFHLVTVTIDKGIRMGFQG